MGKRGPFIPRPARLVLRIEDVPVMTLKLENEQGRSLIRTVRSMRENLKREYGYNPADRDIADAIISAVLHTYIYEEGTQALHRRIEDVDISTIDPMVVKRNAEIRMAVLRLSHTQMGEVLGITRQAWSARLSRTNPSNLNFIATALVVPVGTLIDVDHRGIALISPPADGWHEIVKEATQRDPRPTFDELYEEIEIAARS